MTTYNKATLKTFFQTNDVPTGTDYANLIDSQVNIVETATQQMAGALEPTELITARLSATNANITGTFSAQSAVIGSLSSLGRVTTSAATVTATLSAGSINTTDVSADSVYCSAVRANTILGTVGVVSATGSTQATAAPLTFLINRGTGITDGTNTGYALISNRPGTIQYLFNNGASANLWPPTGGTINGLAANAAFSLAASAMFTILHLTASAYGVK